jgi:hypothetical protein
MRSSGTHALATLGFSFLVALTAACGGNKPAANAPTVASADSSRVGSDSPDLTPASTKDTPTPSEPVKTSAVSSTENGSDIIPPFTSSASGPKESAKKSGAAKKKGGGKKKKG